MRKVLNFGIESGYLIPSDPTYKILRVSSDLMKSDSRRSKSVSDTAFFKDHNSPTRFEDLQVQEQRRRRRRKSKGRKLRSSSRIRRSRSRRRKRRSRSRGRRRSRWGIIRIIIYNSQYNIIAKKLEYTKILLIAISKKYVGVLLHNSFISLRNFY